MKKSKWNFSESSGQFICRRSCRIFRKASIRKQDFQNTKLHHPDESVIVDAEVAKIRPYIAFAKIEGVDFTGDKLKYIMDFQENLHWVIGRDRKKVAIPVFTMQMLYPSHLIT